MRNHNSIYKNRNQFREKTSIIPSRLTILKIVVLLATVLIIGRLAELQLVDHSYYNDLALNQYNNLSIIPAERGDIFLTNRRTGEPIALATDRTLDMIYADPKVIENKKQTAELLSPILDMKEEEILDMIDKQYRDYIKLVINPDEATLLQLSKLDLPGIFTKTAYDYRLEEYKYEDEEVKLAAIHSMSDEEKEMLKNNIVEISANPVQISDVNLTAKTLSKILEDYSYEDLVMVLTKKELRYVPVKRRLSLEESDAVDALGIYGIVLWPENWRFYPEKTLLAHILGFVDKQGNGQYGLEGQYNTMLSGTDGERLVDMDIKGNPIAVGDNQIIKSVENGSDIVLTIDRSIQKYVEEKLAKTVNMHFADSGSVVIMDPKSGEILALANYPTYDPNEFYKVYEKDEEGEYLNEVGPKVFYNNAIASAYEFGSTFKVITAATALDSGEMTMTDTVCDTTGEVKIDHFVIKNADLKAHDCMTLAGVLEKSSNIGALRVGLKIGPGVLRKYIQDFGFGEYTDIGFNNENNGYLGPVKEWGKVKTANASFGQGITGTPLQLVRAYGVIANQGKMIQPILIKEIINGDKVENFNTREVRRVVSPSTAAKTVQMMISSVDNGVARPAQIKGWSVAAKTGTAQVAEPGGYSTEKYIASMAGFAPGNDPQFVMLVKIDYPRTSKFGSEVAAPLFKDIAEYILKYLEIPKDR